MKNGIGKTKRPIAISVLLKAAEKKKININSYHRRWVSSRSESGIKMNQADSADRLLAIFLLHLNKRKTVMPYLYTQFICGTHYYIDCRTVAMLLLWLSVNNLYIFSFLRICYSLRIERRRWEIPWKPYIIASIFPIRITNNTGWVQANRKS